MDDIGSQAAGAVLRTGADGIKGVYTVSKDLMELIFRLINFLVARYEASKEYKLKSGNLTPKQKKTRSGYLKMKKMIKQCKKTGEPIVPFTFGTEMSPQEEKKLEQYSELMNFTYAVLEETVLDEKGENILDENNEPVVRKVYFTTESDMDKAVMFMDILNKSRQHENVEKSDLSDEEKQELHDEINFENTYEQNEKTAQEIVKDKSEFFDAMKKACKENDITAYEQVCKDMGIKFYRVKSEEKPELDEFGNAVLDENGTPKMVEQSVGNFTATINKNASRDYSRNESYYIVDAINPNRFVELTSERNEAQNRTDTIYKTYKNDELVYECNDKIPADAALRYNGWNPEWNQIRESIKTAGGFDENREYFIFNNKEEFSMYKSFYDKNMSEFTINNDEINVGMDYDRVLENIDKQMESNTFYKNRASIDNYKFEDPDKNKLKDFVFDEMNTMEKIDYKIFSNNMDQKAVIERMKDINEEIENLKTQFKDIDPDNPIESMEQNEKISKEITELTNRHSLYEQYLKQLCNDEKSLLAAQSEEITEEKSRNKEASKILSNYKAEKKLKEAKLDLRDMSKDKVEEIRKGLANGLSAEQIKSFTDKNMSIEEMQIRRMGLEDGFMNTQIEHACEVYKNTGSFELANDVLTAYKEGLTKEQVEIIADKALVGKEYFIGAIKNGVANEKIAIVKESMLMKPDKERVNELLNTAYNKSISNDELKAVCKIDKAEVIHEINTGLKSGLSMEKMQPILNGSVTPEQAKALREILEREDKRDRGKNRNSKAAFNQEEIKHERHEKKEQPPKERSKKAKTYAGEDIRVDKSQLFAAVDKALNKKDIEDYEKILKSMNMKFVRIVPEPQEKSYVNKTGQMSVSAEESNFTAALNKNAERDYAKNEPYYIVDAMSPDKFIELTSKRNTVFGRTDTEYRVYNNNEMVLKCNDEITQEEAFTDNNPKRWNPRWNGIKDSLLKAGGFSEERDYFIFSNKKEFLKFKEFHENNISENLLNQNETKSKAPSKEQFEKAKTYAAQQNRANEQRTENMHSRVNTPPKGNER